MRIFKNKNTGAIYNVIVDSIAKMFENSDEYVEVTKKTTKNSKKTEKSTEKIKEEKTEE